MYKAYIYPITKRFRSEVYNPYIDNFITFNSANYEFLNRNNPSNTGIFNILKYINQIDIIYFHWIEKLPEFKGGLLQSIFLIGLLKYCKVKGIRIVWTVHNKIGHSKKHLWLKKFVFKLMMGKSDFIITHSTEGKLVINTYAPQLKHIFYFPHPVIGNLPGKVDKEYDILIWGSLVQYKGIDLFLEYIYQNNLQDKYSIKIIGKCNDASYLNKLLAFANHKISIEDTFLGNTDLHKMISLARIVLFTYSSDSVLSSGALAESVSCGALVVGPDKAAFKDLSALSYIYSYNDFNSLIILTDEILTGKKSMPIERFTEYIKDFHWSEFALQLHQELEINKFIRKPYFNIFLDIVNKKEALEICSVAISDNSCKSLFFVNAYCFNVAQMDSEYRKVLNKSDYIFNDGIGVKLGAYFAGVKLKDNLNGTDLIPEIISIGVKNSKKFYFVGCLNGIAERAKFNLEQQYKNINIVGVYHGFFSAKDEEIIISDINNKKADILIVGMGVPKQELWINKIKSRLDSVKLCIAGGAIIDFIAGNIKRAPKWMRKLNMEWIYRLYMEPQRMWHRYLIGNFYFFLIIGKQLINK